jgi:hypothetical protein
VIRLDTTGEAEAAVEKAMAAIDLK